MISLVILPHSVHTPEEFERWLTDQKLSLAKFGDIPDCWHNQTVVSDGFTAVSETSQLAHFDVAQDDVSPILFTEPIPAGRKVLVRREKSCLAAA